MGKKKVHSGCIYVKYIYFTKFSKVPLLKIILVPLATLFILQSRYFKPWHCSRCCAFLPSLAFTPELLTRLCGDTDKFQWSHFASPAAWGWSETLGYILIWEMVFVIFKNYLKQGEGVQHNRKAQRHKEKSSCVIWDQLGFCGMWPGSFQSLGLVTVSFNVLWQLLLFMPRFKVWEKDAQGCSGLTDRICTLGSEASPKTGRSLESRAGLTCWQAEHWSLLLRNSTKSSCASWTKLHLHRRRKWRQKGQDLPSNNH